MAHSFNPSIGEAETGRSLSGSRYGLQSKFQDRNPALKKQERKKEKEREREGRRRKRERDPSPNYAE